MHRSFSSDVAVDIANSRQANGSTVKRAVKLLEARDIHLEDPTSIESWAAAVNRLILEDSDYEYISYEDFVSSKFITKSTVRNFGVEYIESLPKNERSLISSYLIKFSREHHVAPLEIWTMYLQE